MNRPRTVRARVDGVLLLDKVPGITSNAALGQAKRVYGAAKAGHTGTLDPLASGLLPICFGEATKFAQLLLDAPKRYLATVRFGITTTTQDAEGPVVTERRVAFERGELIEVLQRFAGRQLQVPPAHSALKHRGRPLYEYARAGIDVPRAARAIEVRSLRLIAWNHPDALLDIECSKGTYIRSLAADLGEALACGAHLAALRRTATGGFELGEAATVEALANLTAADRMLRLLPAQALVAHLPALHLPVEEAGRFLHGGAVAAGDLANGLVAVFDSRSLLGIADVADGSAHPRRVLVQDEMQHGAEAAQG